MLTLATTRALYSREFSIMVEDTGKTFNINMHTFSCFALSKEEAIGKMYFERPEFISRKIESIKSVLLNSITIDEMTKVLDTKTDKVLLTFKTNDYSNEKAIDTITKFTEFKKENLIAEETVTESYRF